jgi:hypothetical protein
MFSVIDRKTGRKDDSNISKATQLKKIYAAVPLRNNYFIYFYI